MNEPQTNLAVDPDHGTTFTFTMRSTDARPLLLIDVVKALHQFNVAMERLDQEEHGGPGLLEWRLTKLSSRGRTFRITVQGRPAIEVKAKS